MKKFFLSVIAIAAMCMTVKAEDKLISASFDIIGDSTETGQGQLDQVKLCNGDTLFNNTIGYFYQGYNSKGLEVATGSNLGYGPYWHESNSSANAICLLVPGHCEAEVDITNRIGTKNDQYEFYMFALPVGAPLPSDLITKKAEALDSAAWKMSSFTEGTVTLKANMAEMPQEQYVLAIIFEDRSQAKGMRHRRIAYKQTAVYPAPVEEIVLDTIVVTDVKTTQFAIGDTYEFGGKVTAYYSDKSSADVTSKAVITNTTFNTAGTQAIQISYTNKEVTKTTSYDVNVIALDPKELNSASWDVYGDGTATCIGYGYQVAIGELDTLVKNDVHFFYLQGERVYEANKNGAYWHNSNATKDDNALCLTVRGGVKSTIDMTFLPGKNEKLTYKFYVFAQAAGQTKPEALYSQTSTALDSISIETSSNTKTSDITLTVDLTERSEAQDLYIIYDCSTGCRHRAITYTEKEFAKETPTAIKGVKAATSVKKMMIDGQIVIMKDDVKMNILGF